MAHEPDIIYRLVELHEEFCHAEDGWKRWAGEHVLCPECQAIPPTYFPRSIDIRLDNVPKKSIFEHIWFVGVSIYRSELIDILRPHLRQYVIGECFDEEGQKVDDYVTCYAKGRIITRGNEYSHYRVCQGCSLAWLKTDWQIKKDGTMDEFILRKDLRGGHVLQNATMNLFVSPLVAESVDWKQFSTLELEPVKVIDRPFDDERLPGDPDWSLVKS